MIIFFSLVAPDTYHASRCGAGFIWWSPLYLYCGSWWTCGQAWFTETRGWASWGTERKSEHYFSSLLAKSYTPLFVLPLALWWGGMVRWSRGLAGLQIILLAGIGVAPVCSSNNTVTFASCQPQVSRKACCCHHCWHVDVLAGGLLSLTEAICMPGRVSDSPTASASCPSAVPSAPPGPMATSCCTLSLLLLAATLTENKPRRSCYVALVH